MLGFAQLGKLAIGQSSIRRAYALTAEAGAFTLTGMSASRVLTLPAAVGSFTLTGNAALLTLRLAAGVGAFTLTGQSATFRAERRMSASPYPTVRPRYQFGFAALGQAALGQGWTALETTFRFTGQAVGLSLSMPAEAGAFTLTGYDARLYRGKVLNADAGVFVLSGGVALLQTSIRAQVGTFVLTGHDIEATRFRSKIRAFPRVGRGTVSAKSMGRDIKIRAHGG